MNTVFIDFDGVLFDTLKEAYILCRKAFSDIDVFQQINEEEYSKFYRFKFLVYNSWQYYYVMKLLKEELSDTEFIQEYNKLMLNRDYGAEKEFDNNYYSIREDLMNNNREFWDKLENPFPFFYEIKNLSDKSEIFPVIVSKKNKPAIMYRFEQYDLEISENNIYGKEELKEYSSKAEFISKYMSEKNIKNALFVDDNSNNFKGCNSGIKTLLAGWGNISIEETGLTCSEVISKIKKQI